MPKLIERVRAAAFDRDGALVDSAPDIADAANAMLRLLGYHLLAEIRITTMIGGGVDRLIEKALAENTGAAPQTTALRTAANVFRRHCAAQLFQRSGVFPGATEDPETLAKPGLRSCWMTNKTGLFALPLLEAAGLLTCFAFLLGADSPESRKPSPELLFAACRRLEVRADDLLCAGDAAADVAAARAAGCPTAAVSFGYHGVRPIALERLDRIIGRLTQIVDLSDARQTHPAQV